MQKRYISLLAHYDFLGTYKSVLVSEDEYNYRINKGGNDSDWFVSGHSEIENFGVVTIDGELITSNVALADIFESTN